MRKPLVALILMVVVVVLIVAGWIYFGLRNPSPDFSIGFNRWVGFAPFYYARDHGLFGDYTVDLNFIDLEGDKRAGLQSGRLDMICETMDMFQVGRDSPNYAGVIVFAVDQSLGGDAVIVAPGIKGVEELRGKTVVSEPGQPAHFLLQYALDGAGMTLSEIDLQTTSAADAAAAFMAKRADAAGTYEPYITESLQRRKGAEVLISSADLPGLIVDVCIVSEQVLEDKKALVRAVASGFFEAVDRFGTDSSATAQDTAEYFGLDPDEFLETLTGLRYMDLNDNNRFFGLTESASSQAEALFAEMGDILLRNDLTQAIAAPQEKIRASEILLDR